MTLENHGLSSRHEHRQPPEEHEMWQDSVVLCWWDLDSGLGGYHRIGHQPFHADGPVAHISSSVFRPDRIHLCNETRPLTDADILPSGGFGYGDGMCTFEYADQAVWRFNHDGVAGELAIDDFHSPVDIYPKTGQLAERISSGHLEAAGRVRGELRFEDVTQRVDGLAIRDHGWGKRYWQEILAHRWVAATFGPEATVFAISVLGSDGSLADFGCVIRPDGLVHSRELDIVTYLERDGLTHRGGHVRMVMASGEVIEMDAEVLQKGAVHWMAGQAAINDTMCRITWGDRVGICDFEISNNALAGTTKPVLGLNGFVEEGLHHL